MASSSNNENISPLAALAPLHSLAQLIPSSSPTTGSAGSEREDEGKYILLTSLKPDAWLVHVGRPDGRWWKGAWRVSDMEKLAVCASAPFPLQSNRVVADVLCIPALEEWRHVIRTCWHLRSAHSPYNCSA